MGIIKTQKPFSINEWKRGAKIETRAGTPVRILCTDLKDKYDERTVVATRTIPDGDERVEYYYSNGRLFDDVEDAADIVIVEEREEPERWADDKDAEGPGWYIDALSVVSPGRCNLNDPYNMHFFATEKQAKSARAMARISQLMRNDKRYGGVVTDEQWKNNKIVKFVLYRSQGAIARKEPIGEYHFLAFHTAKQRDLFLNEHENLIKDYLMIN